MFSVAEICLDYGGVRVFHVCFDLCFVYICGICIDVCGVAHVVEFCLFLGSVCVKCTITIALDLSKGIDIVNIHSLTHKLHQFNIPHNKLMENSITHHYYELEQEFRSSKYWSS